jgi:hypothetical protein
VGANLDAGILYAPNTMEAYTRADGAGGLDVFWNVLVGNPYLVAMLKTNVRSGAASAATSCAPGGAWRQVARFRWCATGE